MTLLMDFRCWVAGGQLRARPEQSPARVGVGAESWVHRTVGQMACFASQNSKIEDGNFDVFCVQSYRGSFGASKSKRLRSKCCMPASLGQSKFSPLE
jgi:hypothetical protein